VRPPRDLRQACCRGVVLIGVSALILVLSR